MNNYHSIKDESPNGCVMTTGWNEMKSSNFAGRKASVDTIILTDSSKQSSVIDMEEEDLSIIGNVHREENFAQATPAKIEPSDLPVSIFESDATFTSHSDWLPGLEIANSSAPDMYSGDKCGYDNSWIVEEGLENYKSLRSAAIFNKETPSINLETNRSEFGLINTANVSSTMTFFGETPNVNNSVLNATQANSQRELWGLCASSIRLKTEEVDIIDDNLLVKQEFPYDDSVKIEPDITSSFGLDSVLQTNTPMPSVSEMPVKVGEEAHIPNEPTPLIQCEECKRSFTEFKFRAHSKIFCKMHHCTYCDVWYPSWAEFSKHSIMHEGRMNECKDCGLSFKTRAKLNTHTKAHNRTVYTCSICKASFKNPSELREHSKSHRVLPQKPDKTLVVKKQATAAVTFTCKNRKCRAKFRNNLLMLDHFDRMHAVKKCGECGKKLKGLKELTDHEKNYCATSIVKNYRKKKKEKWKLYEESNRLPNPPRITEEERDQLPITIQI